MLLKRFTRVSPVLLKVINLRKYYILYRTPPFCTFIRTCLFLILAFYCSRILIAIITSRKKWLINDKYYQLSIYEVAKCFKPDGRLSNTVLEFGLTLLREKYKHSNKLIIPYWVCVSSTHLCFSCYKILHSINGIYLCCAVKDLESTV